VTDLSTLSFVAEIGSASDFALAQPLHLYLSTGRRADKPGNFKSGPTHRRKVMADTIKGKLQEAGHAVSETAKKVGNKVSEKAEEAKDWVKEKIHKGQNRADEAADEAANKAEEANTDAKEKADNCGCG
jgi:gas vesicle protein